LAIQNIVIIVLIFLYSPAASMPTAGNSLTTRRQTDTSKYAILGAFLAVTLSSMYILCSPSLVPLSLLRTLVTLSIPLSLSAKFPQIIANFKNSSTGQLSAFLVINSLAGCLARVYTTQQETGDPVIWWSFMLASILNGVLALQLAYYWRSPSHLEGDAYNEKEKEKRNSIATGSGTEKLPPLHIPVTITGTPSNSPKSPTAKPKSWVRKVD